MAGGMYVIRDDKTLVELHEQDYDSEVLLQELLADYPHLLGGDQMASEEPRRWLLVSREVAVPDAEGGSGRWSLDHLFLDQDGTPTFVEVKRASDTRIRREVVGQMLDYAANGVSHWPLDALRARLAARLEDEGLDPDGVLEKLVGPDVDPEAFWAQVGEKLRSGEVRLLFVADEIPRELRRIVEFLNQHMSKVEVLAVEIKQFVGQGLKTLVPRVLGTLPPPPVAPGARHPWDEATFVAKLDSSATQKDAGVGKRLLAWSRERGAEIMWGSGAVRGSFVPSFAGCAHPTGFRPFRVVTNGTVMMQFVYLDKHPPLASDGMRREFARRLGAIPGFEIADDQLNRWPAFSLALLADQAHFDEFASVISWAVETACGRKP